MMYNLMVKQGIIDNAEYLQNVKTLNMKSDPLTDAMIHSSEAFTMADARYK